MNRRHAESFKAIREKFWKIADEQAASILDVIQRADSEREEILLKFLNGTGEANG